MKAIAIVVILFAIGLLAIAAESTSNKVSEEAELKKRVAVLESHVQELERRFNAMNSWRSFPVWGERNINGTPVFVVPCSQTPTR